MPLNAHDEIRTGHGNAFNLTVRCHGLDRKPRRQPIYALLMERVHEELAGLGKMLEKPTGGQMDLMGAVLVALRHWSAAFAVIQASGHRVNLLMQGAAQRRVQFLDAAADRQNRHVRRDGRADQRQGQRVARWIVLQIR